MFESRDVGNKTSRKRKTSRTDADTVTQMQETTGKYLRYKWKRKFKFKIDEHCDVAVDWTDVTPRRASFSIGNFSSNDIGLLNAKWESSWKWSKQIKFIKTRYSVKMMQTHSHNYRRDGDGGGGGGWNFIFQLSEIKIHVAEIYAYFFRTVPVDRSHKVIRKEQERVEKFCEFIHFQSYLKILKGTLANLQL